MLFHFAKSCSMRVEHVREHSMAVEGLSAGLSMAMLRKRPNPFATWRMCETGSSLHNMSMIYAVRPHETRRVEPSSTCRMCETGSTLHNMSHVRDRLNPFPTWRMCKTGSTVWWQAGGRTWKTIGKNNVKSFRLLAL